MPYVKKKVTIVNSSEVKGKNVSWTEEGGDSIFISKDIYNNLRSPIRNKNTPLVQSPRTAYEKFIYDMSVLHDIIIEGNVDLVVDDDVRYLNNYLGQLGLEEKYPIDREVIQLPFFLNADYVVPEEEG